MTEQELISAAAAAMGRKGGLAGKGTPRPSSRANLAKARASLTPEQRHEIAMKGVEARRKKREAEKQG